MKKILTVQTLQFLNLSIYFRLFQTVA